MFTGHSLGAALSTIAALDMALNPGVFGLPAAHGIELTLLTWGSPAVGNSRFASVLEQAFRQQRAATFAPSHGVAPAPAPAPAARVLRVVNANDPVPHLLEGLTNYVHVGERLDIEPRLQKVLSVAQAAAAPSRKQIVHAAFGSHSLITYRRNYDKASLPAGVQDISDIADAWRELVGNSNTAAATGFNDGRSRSRSRSGHPL